MKNKISHAEWAVDKVRNYIPPSKEKSTLIAIALRSDPDGRGAFPGVRKIARESGHSRRTVQRHLRKLVDRGELIIAIGGRDGRGSSRYTIPICRYSAADLASMNNRQPVQLQLAIPRQQPVTDLTITAVGSITPDWAVGLSTSVPENESGASNCHPGGVKLSPVGRQNDTVPSPLPIILPWSGVNGKKGELVVEKLASELTRSSALELLEELDPDTKKAIERLRRDRERSERRRSKKE